MGLTIVHEIFHDSSHIQYEYGTHWRIFHGVLSIPQNIVMDLNNGMLFNPTFPPTNFQASPHNLYGKGLVCF